MNKTQIGVIGPDAVEYPDSGLKREKIVMISRKLGELIAQNGWVLFTGGAEGVMEEASRGAKNKDGLVIGVPGNKRGGANKFVDVEIVTDIDIGSFNCAGLLSADVIVAIPGGAGTLAELCLAYRYNKPVIIMTGFDEFYDGLIGNYLDNGKRIKFLGADSPEQAMKKIKEMLKK